MKTPDQKEIDDVLGICLASQCSGESKYYGLTYEEGIKDAIMWLQDQGPNPLIED